MSYGTRWIAVGEARLDLLGKAEAVYTRLSLLVPAATDSDYSNSLALRLDSLVMLGKVQRTLQRPPEVL